MVYLIKKYYCKYSLHYLHLPFTLYLRDTCVGSHMFLLIICGSFSYPNSQLVVWV